MKPYHPWRAHPRRYRRKELYRQWRLACRMADRRRFGPRGWLNNVVEIVDW